MEKSNTNFPKSEKITFRLRQDLADQLPGEKGERNRFLNRAVDHEIALIKNTRKAGSVKSEAKSAACRENGRKGGRPRKAADG